MLVIFNVYQCCCCQVRADVGGDDGDDGDDGGYGDAADGDATDVTE